MLLKWNDPAVRLTGRWSRNNPDCATATANGSYFEFAFRGRVAVMRFDVTLNAAPYPHLYVEIDGESRVEAPLDQYLRVFAKDANANHVARVILKGSVEMQPRWFQPLVGRTALLGIEVEERGVLPADDRKIVEFVGDSITEGVLIDADYAEKPAYTWDQHNRVYQDDVTATYGWLTAEALNLRPIMMGYGAVGATRGGCGGVVKAASAYSFVYDGVPYAGELEALCKSYSEKHGRTVHFINGGVWIPAEPLHPLRGGHKIVAEHLIPALKAVIDEEK